MTEEQERAARRLVTQARLMDLWRQRKTFEEKLAEIDEEILEMEALGHWVV